MIKIKITNLILILIITISLSSATGNISPETTIIPKTENVGICIVGVDSSCNDKTSVETPIETPVPTVTVSKINKLEHINNKNNNVSSEIISAPKNKTVGVCVVGINSSCNDETIIETPIETPTEIPISTPIELKKNKSYNNNITETSVSNSSDNNENNITNNRTSIANYSDNNKNATSDNKTIISNNSSNNKNVNDSIKNVTINMIANSSSTGNESYTYSITNITNNVSYAVSLSLSKAENGTIAIAESSTSGNFLNKAIAFAYAKALVVANIGETVWAGAIAWILLNNDGSATSHSESIVSTIRPSINLYDYTPYPKDIVPISNPSTNTIVPTSTPDPSSDVTTSAPIQTNLPSIKVVIPSKTYDGAFSGYNYGKSDIERYCILKIQLQLNNETLTKHAMYYMDNIAWDYAYYNRSDFENKYNLTNDICKELVLKSIKHK